MQNLTMQDVGRFISRFWFLLLIGGFALWGVFEDSSSTPLPAPSATAQAEQDTFVPDLTPGNSLPTGTIIKKRSAYLQGEGELKIENGTSYDAVAKLIRDGTSVLTVYIKANSTYSMLNISDGTYWLAFAQGTDWDATAQKFNRNAHVSAFDETFEFETTDTRTAGWEVTLNAVAGGTASASDVDPSQFDQY
ncbi:MAG TPA: hypothetical protein VJH94_00300 [Candidatus Paceibacterota bacterium]